MKNTFWGLCACAATLVFSSCGGDSVNIDYVNAANCTNVVDSTNTYDLKIKAILNANCAFSGCHDEGSHKGGIRLNNYANTKSNFESKDDMLCSIHHGGGCRPMPEDAAKLPDSTITAITCWVKNGYKQ